LTATGQPRLVAAASTGQLVLLGLILHPLVLYVGLPGVAWAVALPNIAVGCYLIWEIRHQTKLPWRTLAVPTSVGVSAFASCFLTATVILSIDMPMWFAVPVAAVLGLFIALVTSVIILHMKPHGWPSGVGALLSLTRSN
jgi:hypothetical protein